MKISLSNLAPARELLLQWLDGELNESGLSFSHHDGRVVVVGYRNGNLLEMLAIELDTYDFEEFKPFGLARAESEIILERSRYSGIHYFEDIFEDEVRKLRLSGIGSIYTAAVQFIPNNSELPDIAAEPVAWLRSNVFEQVHTCFVSFSQGTDGRTDWGILLRVDQSHLIQLDAAHAALMATMVVGASRVKCDASACFHMPEEDVAKLITHKGNGQVSIGDGMVASGNYSWHCKPIGELPPFELVRSKVPEDALEASVELRDLKRILGLDQEGCVKLTLDVSRSKLVDFATADANGNHIDRVMGDDSRQEITGESTVALDRKWLAQAWAALGHGGKVDVRIGKAYEPVTITHHGFDLNEAIKYLRVMIMPVQIRKP